MNVSQPHVVTGAFPFRVLPCSAWLARIRGTYWTKAAPPLRLDLSEPAPPWVPSTPDHVPVADLGATTAGLRAHAVLTGAPPRSPLLAGVPA